VDLPTTLITFSFAGLPSIRTGIQWFFTSSCTALQLMVLCCPEYESFPEPTEKKEVMVGLALKVRIM